MLKINKNMGGSPSKLNSAVENDVELVETLSNVSEQLKSISSRLAGYIEEQVLDPESVEGKKGVIADRLFDWTSDLFAISQDIEYYITPEPVEE